MDGRSAPVGWETTGDGGRPTADGRVGVIAAARGMKGHGGALIAAGTKVVFRNNIVWGNSQSAGNQVSYSPLTPPEMSYNLVQGGAPGTGNLDKDPKFAETARFTLAPDSPAKRAAGGSTELGAYGGIPTKR